MPADGPDAPLVYLVRRARLRYSRAHINQAILSHRDPNSLLALVEVAQGLGFATKAVRAGVAALETLPLPAIVHFGEVGSEGGFGVLEGVSAEGFTLWDSVTGTRVVPHELFVSNWSGIVVMVEQGAERGPKENGYLGRRLIELVVGYMQKPALVGERANPYLQSAALLLMALLLGLSVAATAEALRTPTALLIVASVIGALVAAVTVASTSAQGNTSLKICGRGKLIDCEGVLTSRYSRLFGISLSEIGVSFFCAQLLLLATGPLASDGTSVPVAVGLGYVATIPFSIALIGAQISMRQFCTLCLAIHVVNLSGAATFLLLVGGLEAPFIGILSGFLLMALLFLLLLFFVVPHAVNVSQIGKQLGAIRRIQASPFATLAQIQTARPLSLIGADCGVLLSQSAPIISTDHELVVFVHPGCSRCWTVMQELESIAVSGRARIYLAVAPKDDSEADHRLCAAVVAISLSGGQSALQAYSAAKEYLSGPSSRAGDAVDAISAAIDVARPTEEDLRLARRLVQTAAGFAEAHTEGTPAIFLDGRAVSAPPAHLALLLSQHPELLGSLVHQRERTAAGEGVTS